MTQPAAQLDTLLDLLVCPITHSRLHREGDFLISEKGPVKYPLKDGRPLLLPESAQLPEGFNSIAEVRAAFGKK